MADRVRMKAKSTFNNPLITSHALAEDGKTPASRADVHTVIEGDEFSTDDDHAQELERGGLAERTAGDPEPASEVVTRLKGAQTVSKGSAIVSTPRPTVEAKSVSGEPAA